MDADILTPELTATAGPVAAWFTLEWPGITVRFPETVTLLEIHCLAK